jgi:hypothetical protein
MSSCTDEGRAADRVRCVEDRLDILERDVSRLGREVTRLESELRAFGVELPAINPAGRTPLSPQAYRNRQLLAAARARAGKGIGRGVGKLRSRETAARMMAQYEDLRSSAVADLPARSARSTVKQGDR